MCCRRRRRWSPDIGGIWSVSYDGLTTRDAHCERTAVDSALVEFLNHRFLLGLQAWEGERLFAALLFFWPEFGRCGG